MAKSKDHKAQKAKARKEALRKQKAQAAARPRLLRQNPGLEEALSIRHPLLGYYVNKGWESDGMASVRVIRKAESGEVFAAFLVDSFWKGLKDCYGSYGETDVLAELNERLRRRAEEDPDAEAVEIVPLAPEAAVNLIRGGVVWARRWKFPLPDELNLWLRLVDPAPAWGLDLGMFGKGGEVPIVLGEVGEVERWMMRNRDLIGQGVFAGSEEDEDGREDEDDLEEDVITEAEPEAPTLWQPPSQPGRLWLPGGGTVEVGAAEGGGEAVLEAEQPVEVETPARSRLWLPGG